MNDMPWYFGIFNQEIFGKESEEVSAKDLEKFRLQTYTRAQADLAEQIRFRLMNGDTVDVLQLLDEVERKRKGSGRMSKKQRIGAWIIIDDCEKFIAKCSKCGRVIDSRLISKFPYCRCWTKMEEADRKGSGEMRDILFRAKTVDNNEWVYGYYANCHNDSLENNTTGHFIIEYPDKYHEIYTDTISQYTGLCDKNGVKIFEGDIVVKEDKYCKMYGVIIFGRHSPTTAELGEIGFYIEWVDDNSNLWSEWIRNDLGFWVDNGVEVIGNIYENKELLEE